MAFELDRFLLFTRSKEWFFMVGIDEKQTQTLQKQNLFYGVKRKRPSHLTPLFIISKPGLASRKL